MKKLLLFSTLFFLFQFAFSQSDTNDYYNPALLKTSNNGLNGHWGMNAGAFAGSFNHTGYYGSFLAPNYNFDLSRKFSVQAGFIFSTLNTSGFSNSEGTSAMPKTLYNSFFYTQGTYKLSEKVFLTGGAYTSLLKPLPSNTLNPAFNDFAKGGKIGIGYNINEKSSVYFEMQFNKGNSPFNSYSSPFSNHSFGSPCIGW
jgi:hypothetical protein